MFAFFLAATGHFLPHDIAYLGVGAEQLHMVADGRLAHFMMHDRVSFGGSILAVGVLYLWLAEFPLQARQGWAWWTFLVSGTIGFASFLAYLGYGYLDTWHGIATLVLLPIFAIGLWKSRSIVQPMPPFRVLFRSGAPSSWGTLYGLGRRLLLLTSLSIVLGGLIISVVGMTKVFVPQDLDFMRVNVDDLTTVSPRLIPLIAHDRAGFGGGVCCCGITMFFCILCSAPSKSLWQTLLVVGVAGFGSAIGVHFPIGYTTFVHLAPAYLGAMMFTTGMAFTFNRSMEN